MRGYTVSINRQSLSMKLLWGYSIYLLYILRPCICANILGIVPMPSHSHQVAFQPLWKELSLRGHKVTVLTTDPQKNPKLTNLTEIDLRFTYTYFQDAGKMAETTLTMWNVYTMITQMMKIIAEAQLSYGPVKELMKPQKEKFDVILVEGIFTEFLGFGELLNTPTILISSFDTLPQIHRRLGNPSHPILNPDMFTPFYDNLTFKERLISVVFDVYQSLYVYKQIEQEKEAILRKHFKLDITLDKLLSNVDLTFLMVNPVIERVRAFGPSTIAIGGYERKTSTTPLPLDLQEFLDGAKEGFVYFSLGSNVKSKDLRPETLTAIIETLQSLPYKILWKFEADELPGKPGNVKLIKWAPQQSVLAHPNIKLFVTQGGLQSMEESINSEVPMVVMPFFADQEHNAKLMKSKGIAIIVEIRPYLNKDELKSAILEVIKNPQYTNSVKRLRQLATDNPMTGLEKAVWWTEYVIRNKGAKHLRNPAVDIPLYQYYLLDVIGFVVAITVAAISLVVFITKRIYRLIHPYISSSESLAVKKVN